jgi:hypothetical protein
MNNLKLFQLQIVFNQVISKLDKRTGEDQTHPPSAGRMTWLGGEANA